MSLMFGVISYLPKDGGFILDDETNNQNKQKNMKLRECRKAYHFKQLNWLENALQADVHKVGVYQNWDEDDYNEKIQSLNHKWVYAEGIGPSRARNVILKYFYESNHDWLMLCDDDAEFYNYYSPDVFLRELHKTDKFNDLGMILPHQPTVAPFKKTNYNLITKANYVFVKAPLQIGLQICFIPNLRKRGIKELKYFDVEFFEKVKYAEDALFLHDWVKSGNQLHTLQSLILKLDAFNNSSLLGMRSQELRKPFTDQGRIELDKYSDFELVTRKNGTQILTSKNVPNKTVQKIIIKREAPIEFTEHLIPKRKSLDMRECFIQDRKLF